MFSPSMQQELIDNTWKQGRKGGVPGTDERKGNHTAADRKLGL